MENTPLIDLIKTYRWNGLQKVKNPSDPPYDFFKAENGAILALSTDGLLAFAGRFDVLESKEIEGRLLIYTSRKDAWEHLLEIKLRNLGFDRYLRYGLSYSADGESIAIGDPYAPNLVEGAGVVCILSKKDGGWDLSSIIAQQTAVENEHFGDSVAFVSDKNYLAIGSSTNSIEDGSSTTVTFFEPKDNDLFQKIDDASTVMIVVGESSIALNTIDPKLIEPDYFKII